MGDTDAPAIKDLTQSTENLTCDVSKSSVNELSRSKPNENIAVTETSNDVDSSITNIPTELKETVIAETISDTSESVSDTAPITADSEKNVCSIEVKSTKDEIAIPEKLAQRNKSDIFSLNETKNLPCTIFSVGGAPSKTINKKPTINQISSNDTIGRKDLKTSQFRNPVTGIGVSSNDEFKNKPSKRRDGNPLLGVGYKDDDFVNSHTNQRIPPGGYSKGLW